MLFHSGKSRFGTDKSYYFPASLNVLLIYVRWQVNYKKDGIFSISLVETTNDTPTVKNIGILFQVHLKRDDKRPPLLPGNINL